VLFLSRGLVGYLYQRKEMLSEQQYLKYLTANIILSGFGWGAVSVLFIDPGKPFLMSISVLVLAGVTVGALTSMNGLARLSTIFITLTLWPLIFTVARSDIEESKALVIVIALYYLIIVSSALKVGANTNSNIERSIKFEAREKQIRDIINTSTNAVVTINPEFKIIDWNDTAEAVFGWRRDQVIERDLVEIISPDSKSDAEILGGIKSLITDSNFKPRDYITDITTRNGELITARLTVSAIASHDGNIFTIHINDMTEQLRQEEALTQTYKKSKDLLNSIHAGIVELKPKWKKLAL